MNKNKEYKIIVEPGSPLPTEIVIFLPIKIIKSKYYHLVIEDNSGKRHYFNKDGSYDGWSRECNMCEN